MLSGLVAATFSGRGGVGAAQVCENLAVDTSLLGGTLLPLETPGTLYLEKKVQGLLMSNVQHILRQDNKLVYL